MLYMKFLYIWIIGSQEEEVYMYFPIYIVSLCNMKRPLVGPFFGRFYFYAQILQAMCKECCI